MVYSWTLVEYRLRRMLVEQASSRIKAFQLAIHPHLYARATAANRLQVFRETLRLFQRIPGYQLLSPANERSFWWKAAVRILLRRKPTGWDALYVRAEPSSAFVHSRP